MTTKRENEKEICAFTQHVQQQQLKFLFADSPIFIYIHGGYWQELNKTNSAYCVHPLVAAGIKVIVLDYDLCPNVTLEQIVSQIERAGEYILDYAMKITNSR